MNRVEKLLTQMERVAGRIADDPGANLTRRRARIIRRIVGVRGDEPTRLAFAVGGTEDIDELLAEIDRVAKLIQDRPNRDPVGPRARRIAERLVPRLRDAIDEAGSVDPVGPPPPTGVLVYSQLWMHLTPELREQQLEDGASVGIHAHGINLHSPVPPTLPEGQQTDDPSPWRMRDGRYEMSEPREWTANAIRQHARVCEKLGIRPAYYGVMGPWVARGHEQFRRLAYRGVAVPFEDVRGFSGVFRDGWLAYWAWALGIALQESDRVLAVDGVETEIHLDAPHLHDAVRRRTPAGVTLYRNRRGEHAGPGEEIHISPHEGNRTTGSDGMVVADGWGRNRTRWPMDGGPARPYAGLPDGSTEREVAREVAGWVRAGQVRGREYVGILPTMEWGIATHAESIGRLPGPHRGTADLLTPPWGAALEAMVRQAEGPDGE